MWIALLICLSSAIITVNLKQAHVKPLKMVKTYALPGSRSSVIKVTNYYNLQYYASFQVGTPGQEITLILDSGSSWTWVPSYNCTCHTSNYFFYSDASSTFNASGQMMVLRYGRGMISGQIFSDYLTAGSVSAKQDMILVYEDKDLDGLGSSGLLGLGFKELSNDRHTLVENLKSEGKIEKAEFSIYFSNLNSQVKSESVLILGGIDESYKEGEGIVLNVLPNAGYWIINIDSYSVHQVNQVDEQFMGIVDTGTSFLYVPKRVYDYFFKELNKTGKFARDKDGFMSFKCRVEDIEGFPDLKFTVDGQELIISSKNYLFFEGGVCYLLMESSTSNYWLIGQVFIRQYYMKFDMQNFQIVAYKPSLRTGDNAKTGVTTAAWTGVGIVGFAFIYYLRRKNLDEGLTQRYVLMNS